MSVEVIKKLEEKIKKYEEILDTLKKESRSIGTITSKSYIVGGINFYRVDTGSGESIIPAILESIDSKQKLSIKEGTEVMILKDTIVEVIPESLNKFIPEENISLIKWEEIGGLKDQIQLVRDAIEIPLKHPDLVKKFGLEPLNGILLYGPSGCGKTLIAKAIGYTILKEKNVNKDAFISIKGGDILDKYVGESEKIVSNIFKRSRKYTEKTGKQGVIFIDEAEALLSHRSDSLYKSFSVVPSFLAEMDGLNKIKPLIVLSTNLERSLDPAILRDGRIDLRLNIKRPIESDFSDILNIHLNKVLCIDTINKLSTTGSKLIFESKLKDKIDGAMAQSIVKFATKNSLSRYIKDDTTTKGIILSDIKEAVNTLINQHNF